MEENQSLNKSNPKFQKVWCNSTVLELISFVKKSTNISNKLVTEHMVWCVLHLTINLKLKLLSKRFPKLLKI